MTTLLARALALLERGVVALERVADATESIATIAAYDAEVPPHATKPRRLR